MSGLDVAITVAYLLVAAYTWWHIFGWLYRSHRRDFPILTWGGGDRLFAVVWGGVVALAWPLSVPIFAAGWLLMRCSRTGAFDATFRRLERRAGGRRMTYIAAWPGGGGYPAGKEAFGSEAEAEARAARALREQGRLGVAVVYEVGEVEA